MTPLSFDLSTAKAFLGDDLVRSIESDARQAVNESRCTISRHLITTGKTYWDGVLQTHRHVVWLAAFEKRQARITRLNNTHGATA